MDSALRRPALPFFLLPGLFLLPLAGCHESYSPNTYASDAAQQAAPVQRGIIIGVRQVLISSSGTTGATAGAAAGGIAGAQLPTTALGAVGGALIGTIGGAAAEKAVADTKGWEYIVQESNNNLISITQTSKTALAIGTHVLVIDGSKQARIVQDYTEQLPATPVTPAKPEGKISPANLLAPSTTPPAAPVKAPAAPVSEAAQSAPAAATPAAASPAATAPATLATGTATTNPSTAATPAPAAPGATSSTTASGTTPAPATPSLPASVTNDLMLLQSQTSASTTSSGDSSTTTGTTAPASSGSSTSSSNPTTTQTSGSQ